MIKKLLSFATLIAISVGLSAQPTWTQQSTGFTDVTYGMGVDVVSAVNSNIVWVKGFNGSGTSTQYKVFSRTNDGGNNWGAGHFTQMTGAIMPNVLTAVSYDTAFAIAYDTVTYDASFWRTFDGGTTWSTVAGVMNTPPTTFADGVKFWDGSKGFCYGDPVSNEFDIYTTTDGGGTWTDVPGTNMDNPVAGEYGFNGSDCASIVSGGVGFFFTNMGRVYKTTDYGQNWAVTTTRPWTPGTAFGSNKIYASSANWIIVAAYTTSTSTWAWKYTDNGGATWNNYVPNGTFYEYSMCYVPGSPNTLVATSPFTSTAVGVAYSDDGGLNWTDYLDPIYLQPVGANVQALAVGFADQQNGWVGNYDVNGVDNTILKFHDATAGLNSYQLVNGNDVNIFPNPSNGLVSFSINGAVTANMNLKVVDVVGNVVFEQTLNVNGINATSFDFSNYAKGVYIVQITSGNDIKTQKLMIQ